MVLFGAKRAPKSGVAKPSALDELLATEQEVSAQISAAEREAAELTAAARAEADELERASAEALTAEVASLEQRESDARAALVRQLEDEAARLVARYGALDDEKVATLAAFVCAEVSGLGAGAGR